MEGRSSARRPGNHPSVAGICIAAVALPLVEFRERPTGEVPKTPLPRTPRVNSGVGLTRQVPPSGIMNY